VSEDRLETPKQLAARVNLSERQIRNLIRKGELEFVMIGSRIHIPADAWSRCIERKRQGKWHDEIKVQGSDTLKIAELTTSPGHSMAAAASAALARQIGNKLRQNSANGCNCEGGAMGQVIPLKS
jgi:excisionase family DNA binding protein